MEQKRIKEIEEKRDRDLEELSKKSVRLNFFVLRKDLTVKL
ncbi:Putative membrane spanning protein (plasmid) [Borrelia miyamotoi FR64b]|uniref:Putative membrane spanning protein n=1 Tax=Borrelia miyamotoi FR64b TaxID=1292392 RepID=W5SFY7_9SPIR|nr:Putative membrane spanning protein [Borrelia miyamotoi FR64b]